VLAENLPFIVTVSTGITGIDHAVGVIGRHDDRLFLADPLQGLLEIGVEDFSKCWQGQIIRLGPRAYAQKQPLLSDFSPDSYITPLK